MLSYVRDLIRISRQNGFVFGSMDAPWVSVSYPSGFFGALGPARLMRSRECTGRTLRPQTSGSWTSGPACPSQSSPPHGAGLLSHPDPGDLWSCFGTPPTSCCSAPDFSQVLPAWSRHPRPQLTVGILITPTLTKAQPEHSGRTTEQRLSRQETLGG